MQIIKTAIGDCHFSGLTAMAINTIRSIFIDDMVKERHRRIIDIDTAPISRHRHGLIGSKDNRIIWRPISDQVA